MQELDYTPPAVADADLIRSVIQRVATGPELSKNISREEASSVTRAMLQGKVDPVQAAVLLIGLRMKRETDEEVRGILDGLLEETPTLTLSSNEVISIAEPYNGFNRTIQASLFVLPVLAACGVANYSHGVELCGPKHGVTHHTILRTLGGNPSATLQQAAKQIDDPAIGWAYVDQQTFCPSLFALNELRSRIVKRPVLTTAEVLLSALRGAQKTHLMTGYVHKPYRDTYAMLAEHAGFDSLLLVRGTEGGIIPSFRGRAHIVRYQNSLGLDANEELDIDLEALQLSREYRAEDIPENMPAAAPDHERIGMKWDVEALSQLCAERGMAALSGKPGHARDAAVLGAAMAMWHVGKVENMQQAVELASGVIDSGEALERLNRGLVTS